MKKYMFSTLAIALAIFASAFIAPVKRTAHKKNQSSTVWFFNSNTLSDDVTATNWTTTDLSSECGDGASLPCQMTVENAPDQSSLQTFLNGKSDTDIRDIYADSQRDPE